MHCTDHDQNMFIYCNFDLKQSKHVKLGGKRWEETSIRRAWHVILNHRMNVYIINYRTRNETCSKRADNVHCNYKCVYRVKMCFDAVFRPGELNKWKRINFYLLLYLSNMFDWAPIDDSSIFFSSKICEEKSHGRRDFVLIDINFRGFL